MKVLAVIISLAFVAISLSFAQTERTHEEKKLFREWMKKYNKKYESHSAERKAMEKWFINKEHCDEHNELYEQGKVGYQRGLHEYADLSSEEITKFMTGVVVPEEHSRNSRSLGNHPRYPPAPASIDWREKGLVGPVESQGQCGSCYTFSTAALVNALLRKKHISNDLVAPQQIVDCAINNPGGCGGGWPEYSLQYIKQNGIADENEYPYVQHKQPCEYTKNLNVVPTNLIEHIHNVPTRGNETWLKNIVGSVGPVSVALCDDLAFQFYQGDGVFYEPGCCTELRHAPVITGYGTDPQWGDYWIIKNSWGTSWGNNGYMKLARNRDNMCNVAHYAVYAT